MSKAPTFCLPFRCCCFLTAARLSFLWGSQDTCLKAMTEIKQLVSPDIITIEGADDTDKVADYLEMNETQAQKLAKQYAEKHGYTIIKEYCDRAKTGTNDNREAFQQMLSDAEKKQ